jgi:hypothetical protein
MLVGPMVKVTMTEELPSRMPSGMDHDLYIFNSDHQEQASECIGVGSYDLGAVPEEMDLYLHCFGLAKRDDSRAEENSIFHDGILIWGSPEMACYVRVGWFWGFSNFLANAKLETIKIY